MSKHAKNLTENECNLQRRKECATEDSLFLLL